MFHIGFKKILLFSLTGLMISSPSFALTLEDLAKRLDNLEQQNALLHQENKNLKEMVGLSNEKAETAINYITIIYPVKAAHLTKMKSTSIVSSYSSVMSSPMIFASSLN